jgi:ABC-type transport system involved in cytochrome c biogenesis permease component
MRTLLAKDLRILVRSPLLLVLLVVYPVVVATLIGLSLSRGPDKPRIAFVNEVPEGQNFSIGGQNFDFSFTERRLREHAEPVKSRSRADAERMVHDGDVLAALIVPSDAVQKLDSGLQSPQLDVLVNEKDPIKARLVDDAIEAAVADANRRISRALTRTTIRYLNLLLEGGTVSVLGRPFTVLGLRRIGHAIEAALVRLPRGSPERRALEQVLRFNRLARENFGLSTRALTAISQPIRVDKHVVEGTRVPLTTFAAAVAVAVTLMFVTVLLAAGALALEREQNAFTRLVRGPVSRARLLAEKVAFAVVGSVPLTLLMLIVVSAFVAVEWDRFHLWLLAVLAGSAAFAAMGTLVGSVAREVQTASLLAFTLLLPVAFLALVPPGVLSPTAYDATRAVSAAFPFDPTLDAATSALYGDGGMAGPLAHLGALALAYAGAARLAIGRLA